MPCGLCQSTHENAIVEFELDGRNYKKSVEYCLGVNAFIVKFYPMIDGFAGTAMMPRNQVKVVD